MEPTGLEWRCYSHGAILCQHVVMDEGELEQNVSLDDDELDLVKENMLDHKIDLLVFLASSDCILKY